MSTRSNTTVGPGGYIANSKDSLNRVIHELRELKRAIAATSGGGGGDATEATQLLNYGELQTLHTLFSYEVWSIIPGNSLEFTYVTGPGGSEVVDTAVYKTGVTTILTQSFAYDGNDNVISITAT